MAILPLQLARVSNLLRTSVTKDSLAQTQQSLLNVQNELATGKRLNVPSDDPGAAAIAQQLRKTLEQRVSYSNNLKAGLDQLGEVDSTLGDLTDLVRQAQTIASANVGSDVTADGRKSAAAIVQSIYSQVLSIGNKEFEGSYLFGGDRATDPPFAETAGGVKFVGSDRVLQNNYDENTVLPFMVNGDQVFGALSTRVAGSADLTPNLSTDTRLADLKGAGGDGVHLGSVLIGNGSATALVDLSACNSVGDVVNKINAAGLGNVTAAVGAGNGGLRLVGDMSENVTVNEVAGGRTAADLGILMPTGSGAGATVIGQSVQATITPLTLLSDLRNGMGIDLSGLKITNGQTSATIAPAAGSKVEDLLNAINSSGTGVLARINAAGTGIDIINPVQGSQMTIAENGGTTAADLGVRSMTAGTALAELNGGQGVRTVSGGDFSVTRKDGSTFSVSLTGASTIQDVIDAINTADGGAGVTASFATTGNGIVLTDTTGGPGALSVTPLNYSNAAADLGLVGSAAGATLQAKDTNAVATQGIFANLAALRDALNSSDQAGITTAAENIQKDLDRLVLLRGQTGARVQEMESRQSRMDDQNIATKALLSTLEDTDYNDAMTRFQTLQTALQANLQTTAHLLNISLLDFLR